MKSVKVRLTTERPGKGPDVTEGKAEAIADVRSKVKKADGAFTFEGTAVSSNGETRSLSRVVRPDDSAEVAAAALADVEAWLTEISEESPKAQKTKSKRAKK